MIKYYKVLLSLCLAILICGCNKHESVPSIPGNINVEMVGSWSNDNGCAVTFKRFEDKLVLVKFNSPDNYSLHDIILTSSKESIITKFRALNPRIKFSGNFLEGVVIIDNYCIEPLHKIDN